MEAAEFQELIWQKGRELFRDMPWREDTAPYKVLVSEIMLQQTQVDRVIPKFEAFMLAFADVEALASASLAEVLKLWQGLGYNRRAKYLHEAAKMVRHDFGGEFPRTLLDLKKLPGVGENTAGAIMAYSYNQPAVFIETNVRTAYFHHFFDDDTPVTDKALRQVVEMTLDQENPREFYWALMDYGAYLKKHRSGHLQKSHHYKKQSPLKGSVREVRGQIVAALALSETTEMVLRDALTADQRFEPALTRLIKDGLVERDGRLLRLTR